MYRLLSIAIHAPSGVDIELTGEQQDQKDTITFLGRALMISVMLIFLILITQFNSISKPFIILTEVVFCVMGIMLGFSITKMDMSSIMCGLGFVALAGLVVRNGILLVEFTDLLVEQGYEVKEAVIEAGRIRMTPVILTAVATILGLIPLGIGLNIDFGTLITDLNPHIYFGGDSVAFWGTLSWTMIFGLGFATFLTLILVPVLYYGTNAVNHTFSTDKNMFKNIFSVKGRIRRTEFWLYFLGVLLFTIILLMASGSADSLVFTMLVKFVLIPLSQIFIIIQAIKRCHDIGKSGWWQLIPLWNFALLFRDSNKGANEYGECPKSFGEVTDAIVNPIIAPAI